MQLSDAFIPEVTLKELQTLFGKLKTTQIAKIDRENMLEDITASLERTKQNSRLAHAEVDENIESIDDHLQRLGRE